MNCPHCGAPTAVTGMEELFAFVCSHCGNSVEMESPRFSKPLACHAIEAPVFRAVPEKESRA
jgi:hypothetical protein